MRTLVIGDIHGGYRALVQVLERAKFDKENDLLISLGDIADGWSETPKCTEYLMGCKNIITIRGNHDKWFQDWLETGVANPHWLHHGGKATKQAYEEANMYHDFDIEGHTMFYKNQINFYLDDKNRGFVHGGFTSSKGLGHEPNQYNYYWDRSLWRDKALPGKSSQTIPKLLRNHSEIFIGHTTTTFWGSMEPMNACNVWNLDTGGGWEGKITVMDVDTKEYWQSDLVKDLYPEEKGRE